MKNARTPQGGGDFLDSHCTTALPVGMASAKSSCGWWRCAGYFAMTGASSTERHHLQYNNYLVLVIALYRTLCAI